jgi:cytochrome c biogenesis protein CcmG, thiol:disulfide interchange protein DsbE
MSRRRAVVVTFALALAGCGNAGLRGAGTPAPAMSASGWQQIPLADLDSHPVTLAKVLTGRPALVNLWAPWCERCKTELPDLDRLSRRLEGCGVIVGVAVGEDAPHTAVFVHERGLVYPQVVDEGFHLADALKQSRVPTTLIVDEKGEIVHVGSALDQAAVSALEAALSRADTEGHCKSRPAGST